MSGGGWDEVVRAEQMRCRARRARVLAHPEIAARLTQKPLDYTSPGIWTGYIPPKFLEGSRGLTENTSPCRAALIDICNAVLEAERNAVPASQGEALQEPEQIVTPSSPGSISPKQLTRLHILFGEAEISERDEKLGYCQSVVDRPVESTKHLSQHEATRVMDALSQIINPRGEQ